MLLKWLLVIIVVGLVWFGWRFVTRVEEVRRATRNQSGGSGRRADPAVEDLVKCPVCAAYVSAVRPQRCGRPDCPHLGRPPAS